METRVIIHLTGAEGPVRAVVVSAPLIQNYARTSPSGIIKTVRYYGIHRITEGVLRGMARGALDRGWDVTNQLT